MSFSLQTRLHNQDNKLRRCFTIFNAEIDLLFTPYSSRKIHSRSILHPIYHIGDLLLNFAMVFADTFTFFMELCSKKAPSLSDAAFLSLTVISTAVMDILNAALSILSFLTRGVATLFQGYAEQFSRSDIELENSTMGPLAYFK